MPEEILTFSHYKQSNYFNANSNLYSILFIILIRQQVLESNDNIFKPFKIDLLHLRKLIYQNCKRLAEISFLKFNVKHKPL